jgi:GAF domain-containing protein
MLSEEKKLTAIMGGARAILEKESFPESARAIFDYCCAATEAKSGYVALLNATGEENEVLFLEAGGMPCSVDPNLPMPIRGLRETAYRTHKVVYENDFFHSEWTKFLPKGHVAMHNVMFAPLNLAGETVGILGLANKSGDFTEADAEIASVFGDLAAVALQNSRHLDVLKEKTNFLQKALDEIKTLRGIIPICMHCKQIRNDQGFWQQVEDYLCQHSEAKFSHGLCNKCLEKIYPEIND